MPIHDAYIDVQHSLKFITTIKIHENIIYRQAIEFNCSGCIYPVYSIQEVE